VPELVCDEDAEEGAQEGGEQKDRRQRVERPQCCRAAPPLNGGDAQEADDGADEHAAPRRARTGTWYWRS